MDDQHRRPVVFLLKKILDQLHLRRFEDKRIKVKIMLDDLGNPAGLEGIRADDDEPGNGLVLADEIAELGQGEEGFTEAHVKKVAEAAQALGTTQGFDLYRREVSHWERASFALTL